MASTTFRVRIASVIASFVALTALGGCCSPLDRRLDPRHTEELRASLRFQFEPGVNPPELLKSIEPGDIIAFTAREASSDGSMMFAAAVLEHSHIAIVFDLDKGLLRTLSADSDRGVFIQTLEHSLAGRSFSVYYFPPGTLDLFRLMLFARRARFSGTFDYDWSAAVFGFNSNLTPNTLPEVAGEYTCATVVAAALHFSGISLDRAHCPCQWVSPGDIIFSMARRNVNRRDLDGR